MGVGKKSLKSVYAKVRETTRRNQGDIPVKKVIAELNPKIGGWANYHRYGNNIVLFRKLDRWVRNRIRAYIRRRWRDRGRWKLHSAEELDRMGPARMELRIPRYQQLKLFESLGSRDSIGAVGCGKTVRHVVRRKNCPVTGPMSLEIR